MDGVKKEFAALVQEAVRKLLEGDMSSLEDQYDEVVSFEFQKVSDLNCRVRINQGPYKGPRYFDVYVKEHY
jgi:hypothetical protein